MRNKKRTVVIEKGRVTARESSLSVRLYDAINKAREHYQAQSNAIASVIDKAEELVNLYRHEHKVLEQFVVSRWIKHCPTSGRYYVQLA